MHRKTKHQKIQLENPSGHAKTQKPTKKKEGARSNASKKIQAQAPHKERGIAAKRREEIRGRGRRRKRRRRLYIHTRYYALGPSHSMRYWARPLGPQRFARTMNFSPEAIRFAVPKYMFTDDLRSSIDMSGAVCLTGDELAELDGSCCCCGCCGWG